MIFSQRAALLEIRSIPQVSLLSERVLVFDQIELTPIDYKFEFAFDIKPYAI